MSKICKWCKDCDGCYCPRCPNNVIFDICAITRNIRNSAVCDKCKLDKCEHSDSIMLTDHYEGIAEPVCQICVETAEGVKLTRQISGVYCYEHECERSDSIMLTDYEESAEPVCQICVETEGVKLTRQISGVYCGEHAERK